ncbi:MAG: hypothetical protein U0840_04055 [Gemmataceae bacterium]
MRKLAAVLLATAGLILAVGLPITIAVVFNIDLGTRAGVLVGGMMPGIGVLALAGRLWSGAPAPQPPPDQIPPGHHVCDLCRKIVPLTDGIVRYLPPQASGGRVAFECHACGRYRIKRALTILVMFLAALGVFALIVQLTVVKR